MENPVKKFYGLDGWERLDETVDEVMERVFEDHCEKAGEPYEAVANRINWPVKIEVYTQKVLGESDVKNIAENTLEQFCENYDAEMGDPDGDPFEPTEKMREAAYAFARACVADYVPFMCDKTDEVILYTREMADADEYGGSNGTQGTAR